MATGTNEIWSIDQFQGVYQEVYAELPALNQLFNVITSSNSNARQKFFIPNLEDLVKMGEELEACGKYELDCVSGSEYWVQADEEIYSNIRIEDCMDSTIQASLLSTLVQAVAYKFLEARIKLGMAKHNEVFTKDIYSGDVLADLTDDISKMAELYPSRQTVLLVSPAVQRELALHDIECCDYMIQNQAIGSQYVSKFQLEGIYVLPTAVLSEGSTDDVAYQIYYHPNSLSLEACVIPAQMETLPAEGEYLEPFGRVKAKSTIGHEVLLGLANTGIVRTVTEVVVPQKAETKTVKATKKEA